MQALGVQRRGGQLAGNDVSGLRFMEMELYTCVHLQPHNSPTGPPCAKFPLPALRCRYVQDSLHVGEQEAQRCWEAGGRAYQLRLSGLDAVEFLFAAGPAEPLRPLSAVASGGESARIMLALKAAPALLAGEAAQQPGDADEAAGGGGELAAPGRRAGMGSRRGAGRCCWLVHSASKHRFVCAAPWCSPYTCPSLPRRAG